MFKLSRQLVTYYVLILSSLLLSGTALAIDPEDLLSFDQAFTPTATVLDENTIGVTFNIQPKHYMYRRFLKATSGTDGVELAEPKVSPGITKFDELLGEEVETWHDKMVLTVGISERPAEATELILKLRSQGCLEKELCYPPTAQKLIVQLPALKTTTSSVLNAASALSGILNQPGSGVLKPALPPEQAFVFEAIALDAKQLLLRFTPQQGYYLYKDKFKFQLKAADGISINNVSLPAGEIKNDPEFGQVEVYHQQIEVPMQLQRSAGPITALTIIADFQGCRDGDICYPPMQRQLSVELAAIGSVSQPVTNAQSSSAIEKVAPVVEQDRLAQLLLSHPWKAMFAFFGLGLLLAFTPCVFPMIPILSGIIAGEGDKITTYRAFILSLIYVLAMALTYTVVGVIAGLFGKNLQAVFQNPWIIGSFAGIFVLLALSMFGFYELQLPASVQTKLSDISNRQQGGKLFGVAIMGLLSALIVGPCVAPPLAAALIVIGGSGDALLGGGALFAMSLGMGVPLIIIGTSAGKLLPRAGAWMDAVKAVFGVGLIGMAIWFLERILPGAVIMLLWGLLLVASGIYMGALEPLSQASSGWRKLWKSLGLVLLLIGAVEIIGSLAGGDDWARPLDRFSGTSNGQAESTHLQFRQIKSIADVDAAVQLASTQGKTVMFDFYADWCVECKRMEKTTFTDARIQDALSNTLLIQADVTAYDATDEALIKHFGLIGPPAILFYDQTGKEIKSYRMVGYMAADEFLQHISAAIGK